MTAVANLKNIQLLWYVGCRNFLLLKRQCGRRGRSTWQESWANPAAFIGSNVGGRGLKSLGNLNPHPRLELLHDGLTNSSHGELCRPTLVRGYLCMCGFLFGVAGLRKTLL